MKAALLIASGLRKVEDADLRSLFPNQLPEDEQTEEQILGMLDTQWQ